MSDPRFPRQMFERLDDSPDDAFYQQPRLVTHIDDNTIAELNKYYGEFLMAGADVLDLMSSWVSHFPEDKELGRVSGLGMNEVELARNLQLTDFCVHNLNENPQLPYEPDSFDRAVIAVSIQYLIKPVEVLQGVRQVLREGGAICIAMSHRLFPTKAILAFRELQPKERIQLVATYLETAGFNNIEFIDRSPSAGDPLWLVIGYA